MSEELGMIIDDATDTMKKAILHLEQEKPIQICWMGLM